MNLVLAMVVVVGFAVTIEYLDLPGHARDAGRRGMQSIEVLQDDSMDDREKEEALQRHAGRLFGLLGILAGGSVLALGLPLAGVWGLGKLGVGSFSGTLLVLERLDFLAGVTVVGLLGYLLIRSHRTP